MTLILKIERALAFAKELNLNDNQTRELMALILEVPTIKWNIGTSPSWPNIQPMPWNPGDHTIITLCDNKTPPTITYENPR